MPCEDDRPLTQQERAAGFRQQRTGVPMAVRPYQGPIPPGMQPLIDYLNREVIPAVRQTRKAVNDVYLPVVDNAPSGNPLGYYFSVETANADPTPGRMRLDQAVQNTATTVRVSQENGRLQDVGVFLDIMSGSATSPLGVLTLVDSINPGRFLRFDLNSVTDQGTYWDLDVDPTESSHDSPFVDGEAVVLAFMPGAASAGATVPIDALEPIADETFLGNLSGAPAAPSANLFSDIDSASVTWSSLNNAFERAALTGDVTANPNNNTTAFRLFSARSVLANATNGNAVPTELQGSTAHHYLKVAGTGTTLVFEAMTLASFPTIADDTFLANISGGVAVPTAVALTTLAGAGLTGGADAILNVGAGTRITVNANDVQLAAGAAESFLGNFTAGSAVADYRAGSSVAGAGLTYTAGGTLAVGSSTSITVNADDVQRAALTGAIAASANSNATVFAGIRDNGSAENDRTNLNFVSSASATAVVTDDAGNDELEVTFQRAALTGAVVANANDNATFFGGILDNGAAENNRTNLNFVSTGGVTMAITDDAGNDELEVAASMAMPIIGRGALLYNFDTSTTIADPGSGDIRLNNATPSSATSLAIDDVTSNGYDIGGSPNANEFVLATGQDSANVCFITIVSRTTPTKWASYFSSTGGNDNTGYWDFALTHIASSGGSFTNAEAVAIMFTPVAPTRNTLVATQTQQETSSVAPLHASFVTPQNQHWHRSAAKAWGRLLTDGTTQETYNITSISDTGTGAVTITIATDFSGSGTYCQLATNSAASGSEVFTYVNNGTIGTGSTQLLCSAHDGSATDPSSYYWVAFGDQA